MVTKKKGLEEEEMVDLTDDSDEDTVSEQEPEKEPSGLTAKDLMSAAGSAEDQINLVQGARRIALERIIASEDIVDAVTSEEGNKLLKDMAQTATQKLRADAEMNNGEGSKAIALALAGNNKGLRKLIKRSDTSIEKSEMGINPVADAKVSFGSKIKEVEKEVGNNTVEYESLITDDD